MGHGLRGAVTAWLALIVLQTVGTQGGSGRLVSLFGDLDTLVKRALDPGTPAIPDRGLVTSTSAYNPPPLAGPYTPEATGAAGGLHSRPI
jgi:hypothetical protein